MLIYNHTQIVLVTINLELIKGGITMKETNGAIVLENIIKDNEKTKSTSFDSVTWGYDSWQDSHR